MLIKLSNVFSAQDASTIYQIPIEYQNQRIDDYILKKLRLPHKKSAIKPWVNFTNKLNKCKREKSKLVWLESM